jgi:hypothetical protein
MATDAEHWDEIGDLLGAKNVTRIFAEALHS